MQYLCGLRYPEMQHLQTLPMQMSHDHTCCICMDLTCEKIEQIDNGCTYEKARTYEDLNMVFTLFFLFWFEFKLKFVKKVPLEIFYAYSGLNLKGGIKPYQAKHLPSDVSGKSCTGNLPHCSWDALELFFRSPHRQLIQRNVYKKLQLPNSFLHKEQMTMHAFPKLV